MRPLLLPRISLVALMLTVPFSSSPADADEPKALAGTWSWTWKDGEGKMHKHVLDVEAAAGKLTARERFDDLESIKVDDLKLKDEEVTFTVKRGDRTSEYKGKLAGDKAINGVVIVVLNGQSTEYQWTAERAIVTKKE